MEEPLSARWGARPRGGAHGRRGRPPSPVWKRLRAALLPPAARGEEHVPSPHTCSQPPRGSALMLFYLRSREKGRPWPSGSPHRGAAERSTSHRNAEGGGCSSGRAFPRPSQPRGAIPSSVREAADFPMKHPHDRSFKNHQGRRRCEVTM